MNWLNWAQPMDDVPDDEIARWAEGLSPEGAPGVMSQRMREFLGDQGYEKAVAQNDAMAALYLQKQTLLNNILTLVVSYGALFGIIGLVGSTALVIKFIF